MQLKLDRVRSNVEKATTEDLLDRATVYRNEMEDEALVLIDAELEFRNVSSEEIKAHWNSRIAILTRDDGSVVKCSFCHRPAVDQEWSWHRIFGLVPVIPRIVAWCGEHLPERRREPEHDPMA